MIADSFVCFPLINLAQKDIVLTFISMLVKQSVYFRNKKINLKKKKKKKKKQNV